MPVSRNIQYLTENDSSLVGNEFKKLLFQFLIEVHGNRVIFVQMLNVTCYILFRYEYDLDADPL